MMTTWELLTSEGPVVQISDRWFITMDKAGFNLPENNGRGWATEMDALLAHLRILDAATRQQSATVMLESHRDGLVQWEAGR